MRHRDPEVARLELFVCGDVGRGGDRCEKDPALESLRVDLMLAHGQQKARDGRFEIANLEAVLFSQLHEHSRHPRNPILGSHPV
jgi:hypothetical protein